MTTTSWMALATAMAASVTGCDTGRIAGGDEAPTATTRVTAGSEGGAGGTTTTAGGGGAAGGAGGGGVTTTAPDGGAGGAPLLGVDPSNGKGGTIAAGQTGTTPTGAIIRVPSGYDPAKAAAPVVWLMNEELPQWSPIADADGIVLVDLDQYNDINAIVGRLNDSQAVLESQYNVDRARYYWAGWSAGGNIAVMLGAQNQDTVAGTLVFPGTGGGNAQQDMLANKGHKIRLFYACGDQDPNFSAAVVENESKVWSSYGYQTRFEKVAGAGHYLDEATYGVRAKGWAWMKGFNLKN